MKERDRHARLMLFPGAVRRDPAVEEWMNGEPGELRAIARYWFGVIRESGEDVRELLHDGHPTACVVEAAFAYVDTFRAHLNVGFFRGVALPDPTGLLAGTGRVMRHVKVRPGSDLNEAALADLIRAAYLEMKGVLEEDDRPG